MKSCIKSSYDFSHWDIILIKSSTDKIAKWSHNKIKESPAPPKIPPQKWLFDPLLHWLMGREHFGREKGLRRHM